MLFLISCTDEAGVKNYAEVEEWNSYQITGWKPLSCSSDDFYSTGFVATKNGKKFSGAVCRGLFFRSSTLRLN